MSKHLSEIRKFLKKLHIEPKKLSIYIEALTHKTYANENNLDYNYQRLEFLGDACIQWIVTNFVFSQTEKHTNKKLNEGEMTRIRSKLVCSATLSQAAQLIGLNNLIIFGNGAEFNNKENSKKANMDKIYEDVFEAFIGAVAQDQGIKKAQRIIDATLINFYKQGQINSLKDYKTIFQEIVQKNSLSTISYEYEELSHNLKQATLYWNGSKYGIGYGPNRKDAEQDAAANALAKLSGSGYEVLNNLQTKTKKPSSTKQ
ncbi:ribonuclease III [Ureaplasma miroungigenitalium]|uniref:Ribonuclease 3 n=1 Tax=Ureaplasma miroungigenitalium TaxID=1042321 RepID=A0ABT3BMK3_9BACT|nr:ribonuclease III [Ureaplasma miroungigenitalium]MCV3728461.1 ribonuclease III [Ureaplasma miroungigenitalium]